MTRVEDFDYTFRIAVVGAPETSKSSLLEQFISSGLFISSKTDYSSTIEINLITKIICLDGNNFRTQIFDTSGDDRMHSAENAVSYILSDGLIAVYEVCDAESFDCLPVYFENAKSYTRKNIKIILIGISKDLMDEREVSYDRAKAWAEEVNVPYYEVNVSDRLQVEYIFVTFVSMLLKDKLAGDGSLKLEKSKQQRHPIPHRHKCIIM